MAMSNRERLARGLEQLREGLTPFVERELRARLGKKWLETVSSQLRFGLERDERGDVKWDTAALLKAMGDNWQSAFRQVLGYFERSLVGELREVRNRLAHEEAFSSDDAYRALDSMQRLLQAVAASEQSEAVGRLKVELQRTVFAEQRRSQVRSALAVEGRPEAGLEPWRNVMSPHPDVASGRYVQAEFAADLAQVHRGEGSEEYLDPVEFYRRTFITAGLHDLLADALRRLQGKGGEPVVELQTNFGGGKTHAMLALYHLFGGTPSDRLPGLEPVLVKAGLERAAEARRAVLVGTALSPGSVRKKPDKTEVRTLWGELAWQLGGAEGFARIADSDRLSVPPGSEQLCALFRRYAPCLVLIDEWVAYARLTVGKRDLPAGDFEAQASFAQALTEAARASDRTLVVATVPSSRIEIGGEHGEMALDTLRNVLERVGKPWRPATAEEGFEIVRRRLFEPMVEKTKFAARDAVIEAFARMYRANAADFPAGCGEAPYRRKLEAAYPIHPELFDRLYEDWSTLDTFQRTRGVLRLLAKVIHRLWETNDLSLMILPASVAMDDQEVKSEITRYLDDVWEPIISQDVDGPGSLPLELDRSNPNLGRYSASRRVARTLYLATASGAQSKNPGIDDRRLRLGCAQPGEPAAVFGDALRRLSDRAKHLHQDGNRYWISTKPNLNRLAEDRAGELRREPEKLHEKIVRRLRRERQRGGFAGVHVAPESSADVPDEARARLVILPPAAPHRGAQTASPALELAAEILDHRGNAPRLRRNTLAFLAADERALADLEEAVAQHLAWESILDDEEQLNLDAFQRRQAKSKKTSSEETVVLRLHETWTHALVPNQPEPTAEVDWEVLRVQGNGSLAERVSRRLEREESLLPRMGGLRLRHELDKHLWRDRDHVAVGELAEYFARYLYLPRVRDRETVIAAVADGASLLVIDDTFGIAEGYDEATGRYRGLRAGQATNAVIDDHTLVVKPEAALRQEHQETGRARGAVGAPGEAAPGGSSAAAGGPPPQSAGAAEPVKPTVFHGSARLDPVRVGSDAGRIAEEVIQHLSTLPGAEVEVTLEIHVRVRDGVDDDVVRTVSENCNSLRFSNHGFE
ncbi:MAG: ATP-binding protein, partial [Acidobacteria bacterium]